MGVQAIGVQAPLQKCWELSVGSFLIPKLAMVFALLVYIVDQAPLVSAPLHGQT